MFKILIIEDEEPIRKTLIDILTEENKKHQVDGAEDGEIGLKKIEQDDYDLVICDIKMAKIDGVSVLENTRLIKPQIHFIMISGHGDIDTAVECIKKGAFDYISKPIDLNRLLNTVRNALDRKKITQENTNLISENKVLKKKISGKYKMIGDSVPIIVIKEMIEKVALKDVRVLITGPNGTGKEIVAHWIHEKSERRNSPLIEVNCAAIPSELIESELFGHEKGSFTGAIKDKQGKFELADNGTIFLDEIGDMSLSAQAKVLRALQEGKISRVGGDKEIKVDVRVLTATNKDLRKEIELGNFREDLYHRLAVIEIKIPALNDRRDDIPALVTYFAKVIAEEQKSPIVSFSKDALAKLQNLNWTGNIRELRNVIERLIILCNDPITLDDVINYCK